MYALNSAARLLVPGTLLVLGLANFVPAAVAQENDQSASQQADEAPAPPAPPRPAASPVSPDASDQAGAVETDDLGYETLLQGPVHEAFAAPIDADLTDGVRVYSEAPPKPINEQPPEQQPEGKDITWVPGYWSWSDDAGKYVWVSGLYRKAPPGRTWVAGYWTESGSGYRWTSGYWAPADSTIDQPQASRSEPK